MTIARCRAIWAPTIPLWDATARRGSENDNAKHGLWIAAGFATYLRVAQKYMLISMLTGTSTILGLFQAIIILLNFRATSRRQK